MKRWLLFLIFLIPGCQHNQRQSFENLSAAFQQWYQKQQPVVATSFGLHENDHLWPDISDTGHREYLADLKRFDLELVQIDRRALNRYQRADYEVLSNGIEQLIFQATDWQPLTWDPGYVLEQIRNGIAFLVYTDLSPMTARVSALMQRLDGLPDLLESARTQLDNPTIPHLERAHRLNEELRRLLLDVPLQINADDLTLDHIDVLLTTATATLKEYDAWLEDEVSERKTRSHRMGETLFVRQLQHMLNEDISFSQIKEQVNSTYLAIQDRMLRLALPLYLQENDEPVWVDRDDTLDVIDWVLADIEHSQRPVMGDSRYFSEVKTLLEEYILAGEPLFPPSRLDLVWGDDPLTPLPATPFVLGGCGLFEEQYRMMIQFELPQFSTGWVTVPHVNLGLTNSAMRQAWLGWIYPGITELNLATAKQVSPLRVFFANPGFSSAWRHYVVEFLLADGLEGGDVHSEIRQLLDILQLSLAAVVDLEVHTGDLEWNSARDFLQQQGFVDEEQAGAKWEKAVFSPGLATAALVEYNLLWNLHRLNRRQTGDQWRALNFHNRILDNGILPVRLIHSFL